MAAGLPSVSYALAERDSLMVVGSTGFTETSTPRLATPDTPYLLASVTKPIVATALSAAAQRGLVDLDAPISDYLDARTLPTGIGDPGIPTVLQVAQHTGGLGTHFDFTYGAAAPCAADMIARYGVRFRPPGLVHEYSNLGYGALGLVLERACDLPLTDAVAEMLRPLDIAIHIGAAPADAAVPHSQDGEPYPPYDTSHHAASMAWMSVADLARFGARHAEPGLVLDEAMLALAHTASGATAAQPVGYGVGWATRHIRDSLVVRHGGAMGGVSTLLVVVPARRLAVVVAANQTNAHDTVHAIATELLRSAWPQYEPIADEPAPTSSPPSHRDFTRRWTGSAWAENSPIHVELDVGRDGAATLTVAGSTAEVATSTDANSLHTTATPLAFPTADAGIDSPTVELTVSLGDDSQLTGALRAIKHDEAGGRVGNCFSHWITLTPA